MYRFALLIDGLQVYSADAAFRNFVAENERFITQMYICVLIMARPKNPNKKNITLMVDGRLYGKYRDFCQKEGFLVSRQFEKLMEKELKVTKDG